MYRQPCSNVSLCFAAEQGRGAPISLAALVLAYQSFGGGGTRGTCVAPTDRFPDGPNYFFLLRPGQVKQDPTPEQGTHHTHPPKSDSIAVQPAIASPTQPRTALTTLPYPNPTTYLALSIASPIPSSYLAVRSVLYLYAVPLPLPPTCPLPTTRPPTPHTPSTSSSPL